MPSGWPSLNLPIDWCAPWQPALRAINESALVDVEMWSKSAAAQLDAQLRERRRNFTRRIEAIDRIQQATGGLNDRINEIGMQEKNAGPSGQQIG